MIEADSCEIFVLMPNVCIRNVYEMEKLDA